MAPTPVAEAGVAVTTVAGTRAAVASKPVVSAPMAARKRPLALRELDMPGTLNERPGTFGVGKHHGGEQAVKSSREQRLRFPWRYPEPRS